MLVPVPVDPAEVARSTAEDDMAAPEVDLEVLQAAEMAVADTGILPVEDPINGTNTSQSLPRKSKRRRKRTRR